MVLKALLALFLALPASAQEWNNACFHGLNDADSAATLGNCESPDLLNVESNLQGTAVLKRKGFSEAAALTITTAPVNGSHSFIDSSGNRLDIVCQDMRCLKSTNGNAFTAFLTTAAAGITRWSFVDQGGILYGANDRRDPIMKYDGTTRSSPPGMPLGSILELTQDRLAIGDISGQPNRVHFSSAGAHEQFTIGVNPEDSFYDDVGAAGDRIRGIKCVQGACFIFKTASITLYDMGDQYTTQGSVISPTIGTTDPASIVAAGSDLYFRAQDKNYWRIGRSGLEQISQKIPALVKSQSGGLGGGENTNTQTTRADWEAGDQTPDSSWNTTTTNGSIFPSSVTLGGSTSAQFALGTFSGTSAGDLNGFVVLSTNTAKDNFSNGDYTVGATTWSVGTAGSEFTINTVSGNKYLDAFGGTNTNDNLIYTTAVPLSSGSWRLIHQTPGTCAAGGANCVRYKFYKIQNGDNYQITIYADTGGGTPVYLSKIVSGVETQLDTALVSLSYNTDHTYLISRNASGNMSVTVDGIEELTATDTSISGPPVMTELALSNTNSINYVRGLLWYQYKESGSYTSPIYDTAFSTPVWGALSSTYTAYNANGEGNIAFYLQSSAVGDGTGFSTALSSSDTFRPSTLATRRYWRLRADFTSSVSTKTPTLDSFALSAATTGQFTTQCIQPNSSISAWGTLSCAQTATGAGSLVYYATSAVSCAALPTSTAPVNSFGTAQAGWTQQTNNSTLSIATNTAVIIGWRSLLGSATDQAQVDACVLAWNEGTPAQPSWATYDSRKQAIYWTSTINGASSTNRLLKYDLNLGQWYPFDIAAQAPKVINNELYFGGAAAGTWNRFGLTDSDNGSAINAYWTSKDIGGDKPFQEKKFKTLSILNKNQGTGSMTGTWTNSIGATGSYTISLSTGSGLSYARSNYNLPSQSPQQFMKIRVGNNSAVPFEVLGMGLTWEVLPWRVAP